MKFRDASAIVPLLVNEAWSEFMTALYAQAPEMLVWWGAQGECASALARLEREGVLGGEKFDAAYLRLSVLAGFWQEIDPSEVVRESALRFLRVQPLRAGDALQLGAAFIAADRRPPSLEVVTLDARLAD
jgi:uncharacterized protein